MIHPAIAFLDLLDPLPNARFTIETYTDVAKGKVKPAPDPLARQYHNLSKDAVQDTLSELEMLNAAGAGVFVAVNQFSGRRCKTNLRRVRGVHADFDGVPSAQLDAVRSLLPPTIEVRSSEEDNCHFYWLLAEDEELSAEEVEAFNRGLVELGADRAATDVSRLLRLPGFRHMKGRAGGGSQ